MILALCSLSSLGYAQNTVIVNGSKVIGAGNKQPIKTIDTATLKCYYAFSKKDTLTGTYRTDTLILEIGNQVSKFYDLSRQNRDALLEAKMKNMEAASIKSINVYKGDKSRDLSNMPGTISSSSAQGESYRIYKYKTTGKTTVIDYAANTRDKFIYEEDLPMNWQIATATDTIQGYACQKALLNFRGRNYIAWFSPEIPVNDGPWKFMGLPGLILKIADTKNIFSFSLAGLQQLQPGIPILTEDPKNLIKCSRAEFEKQKSKHGSGTQLNFNDGNVIISELPEKFNYLSMEIE